MWELIATSASAFGLVFLAELGDKTQLLAMGFGARYPMRTVMIGLTLGFAAAGADRGPGRRRTGRGAAREADRDRAAGSSSCCSRLTLRGVGRSADTVEAEMEHVVHTRNVVLSIALRSCSVSSATRHS